MKYLKLLFQQTIILSVFIVAFTESANAQVFVSENFNAVNNPALPAGWQSPTPAAWVSGMPDVITPNALSDKGISLNTTEHTKAVGINGSQTSAQGAVLAFPAISLLSSDAALIFDIAFLGAENNGIWESLVLEVSTNNGASWSHVGFINANNHQNVWETRSISLNAFTGQSNLKFGIRYHNQGSAIIGAVLDNIRIISGVDGSLITTLAGHTDPKSGTSYLQSGTGTNLRGMIKNMGNTTLNNYYIKYKVGNAATQSSPLITTPLNAMSTANIPTGLTVNIPTNDIFPIKAWIEAAGDVDHSNDTASTTTIGLPHIPVKRPVFEEGTGTWCGWCPRGAVFMDHFATNHPNGDAAQIAVHNNDPMRLTEYDAYMSNYNSGFPNLIIDRQVSSDPRYIDSSYTETQQVFGFADFSVGTPNVNGSTVTIPVSITPVVSITNPKLALVVTESNVKVFGLGWAQNNYYSGGGSGLMDGWENEGTSVDNVNYHFVARGISPEPGGSAAGLPSTLVAGNTYNVNLTTTLNSAWKTNDLQYIALLINGNNTSILNSAFTPLPVLQPTLGSGTSIVNKKGNIRRVALYPNPTADRAYLAIETNRSEDVSLTLTDLNGKSVSQRNLQLSSGINTIELETINLSSGMHIIRMTGTDTDISFKFNVVK